MLVLKERLFLAKALYLRVELLLMQLQLLSMMWQQTMSVTQARPMQTKGLMVAQWT
jgi:hypothetical protein